MASEVDSCIKENEIMKIVILGWGSLIWDKQPEFDELHEHWQYDGPNLKIEFSRVSQRRKGALTLVLDPEKGKLCQVAYSLSLRKHYEDAICDLRCREGTTLQNIGFYLAEGSKNQSHDPESVETIKVWASKKKFDIVIWTDLLSNFEKESKIKKGFSLENAISHIQLLDAEEKAKAAEYIWRAPEFVKTPLREMLQPQPWFPRID
jgi:hypothetical protein